MKSKKGFVLSTYVYILLVFFLLLLGTMLLVLNNTRLLSVKLREQAGKTSGLVEKDFSFVLLGDKDITIKLDEEYIEPGFKIQTSGGTDLKDNVIVDGSVDTSKEGTYTIYYRATYNSVTKELVRNVNVKKYTGVDDLLELVGTNGLTKTEDGNVRYVGSSTEVKNYVEFGNDNELWRIIGVFEVETSSGKTEKLMKLVRNDSLISASWDSSASGTNYGYGINEWSQADIKTMLNTYYIGESTTCTYCNTYSQETCSNDCASSVTPINSTYKNMIEEVVWHTGGFTWESMTPAEAYAKERPTEIGTNGEGTGKICTSGTYCNDTVERTIEWTGKVGLIYPSDYGFAGGTSCTGITNSTCGTSNWLKPSSWYWTISPRADSSYAYYVWGVHSDGYATRYSAYNTGAVRPSVYLKSNVQITGDGDGSSSLPYKLSM